MWLGWTPIYDLRGYYNVIIYLCFQLRFENDSWFTKLVGRIQVFLGWCGWGTYCLWSIWLSRTSSSYHTLWFLTLWLPQAFFFSDILLTSSDHWSKHCIYKASYMWLGWSGWSPFCHFVNHGNGTSYLWGPLRVHAIASFNLQMIFILEVMFLNHRHGYFLKKITQIIWRNVKYMNSDLSHIYQIFYRPLCTYVCF